MGEGRRVVAGFGAVAIITIAILAVLAAGGLFTDRRSDAAKSVDQLGQQMQQSYDRAKAHTPRP